MSTRKPTAISEYKPKIDGSLSPEEVVEIIQKECKASIVFSERSGNGKYTNVFTPHAWDQFNASVNYAKKTAENALESQYFLEGYYFQDAKGRYTTVVTNVITPYSSAKEGAFAQLYSIDDEVNPYKLVEQKEAELIKHAGPGKDLIRNVPLNAFFSKYGPPHRDGFGHTHPGLHVFLSSTDKTSVFAPKGEPWITMVADPINRELLVTNGTNLERANIIIMSYNKNNEKRPQAELVSPTVSNTAVHEDTSESEGIIECIKSLEEAIRSGCSFTFKASGKLPGKLRFKGEFRKPKKSKKKHPDKTSGK